MWVWIRNVSMPKMVPKLASRKETYIIGWRMYPVK